MEHDTVICPKCQVEILVGMYPFCKGSPESHGSVYGKTAVFPFDSKHITPDGTPLVIDSLHHLRRVEREYGVVLSAFSKDNVRDIDPIKQLPRYRGEEVLERRKR